MAVYIATSADSGAPTLSGTAGDLVNLLDKLLCDGFGSYTAPGWEKEFTGTNKRVYRAPNGNRFRLRVDDNGTGSAAYARVIGYESMSDVDTGTNAFPTNTQVSGGLYAHKSNGANATTRAWWFYSDGRIFYLTNEHSTTLTWFSWCFGDIESYAAGDTYATVIGASNNANASSVISMVNLVALSTSPSATGWYASRIATGAGSAIPAGPVAPMFAGGIIGRGNQTYPSPNVGGLLMSRILIYDGDTNGGLRGPRGYLPGIWAPLHLIPLTAGDTFSGAVGSALAGRTFVVRSVENVGSATGQAYFETSDTWRS